jgi:hypothetical protein
MQVGAIPRLRSRLRFLVSRRLGTVLGIVVGLLAGLYPARIQPVEALRR